MLAFKANLTAKIKTEDAGKPIRCQVSNLCQNWGSESGMLVLVVEKVVEGYIE